MSPFLLNLLLALAWVAATGSLAPGNLLAGLLIGFAVAALMQPLFEPRARGSKGGNYGRRVVQAVGFALFFLQDLVLSNLRVARDVLSPRPRMQPGVVAIPLDVETDGQITLLANLITMTPGTLSLDVSEDRRTLYVHAMFVHDPEALRREIKEGFERRVLEVMP